MPPQGRKTPPLFDLLSRNVGQGTGLPRVGNPPERAEPTPHQSPTKPVVRIELKPYQPPIAPPAPVESTPPATRETSHPAEGFWTQVSNGRALRLPIVAAYAIVLGIAGVLLATWAVAYRMGVQKGKDDMSAFVRSSTPQIVEPVVKSNTTPPRADSARADATRTGTDQVTRTTPLTTPQVPILSEPTPAQPAFTPGMTLESLIASASLVGPDATMTSRGFVQQDPRITGHNYLELATLSREDCARAVLFLSLNGLESIGVPLDRGGTRANNASPRFRLVAWPGLSTDQFREGTSKQTMEREVARLGRIWSTEHKGPSDFRMPQWTKFVKQAKDTP